MGSPLLRPWSSSCQRCGNPVGMAGELCYQCQPSPGDSFAWVIEYNPKPIPASRDDWDFRHVNYDGPESPEWMSGTAASEAEAKAECMRREGGRS